MARYAKAALLGLAISLLGLCISLFPTGSELEENLGLGIMFKLRGPRRPPAGIMIVSLEKVPDDPLDLPRDPINWPRSLHGRLVDELSRRGASVIAFDMTFDQPRPTEQDLSFAAAMKQAGNVLLCAHLENEVIAWPDREESQPADIHVERLIPPVVSLAEAARAYAPFPLPKVPVRLSQYWTYKKSAGEYPSLPAVAFQLYALDAYDLLYRSLTRIGPQVALDLPRDRETLTAPNKMVWLFKRLHTLFHDNPSLTIDILHDLQALPVMTEAAGGMALLAARLVALYSGQESRHLNFYGPAGAIPTIPYHKVLTARSNNGPSSDQDLHGKAVFVGLAERQRAEQKDDFYTVFSRQNGIDLSGVEIAATAFGNLLEDMEIRPRSWGTILAIVIIWGMLLGSIARYLSPLPSFLVTSALVSGYLGFALHEFGQYGRWYPLVVPLFLQAPAAVLGGLLWHFIETRQERHRIHRAFGHYLPPSVVDQLAADMATIATGNKVMHGVCLFTDAGRYTALSETMGPEQLHRYMNRYYETLFQPVRSHGGLISDVIGDSMLAIWAAAELDRDLCNKACCAALEIIRASRYFSLENEALGPRMSIRIGIHSGQISLGSIGALDHFEYRPIGDVVNTASRIEGLNKYLETQLLVSAETVEALTGLLTRDLGEFLLAGKSQPVRVHELLGSAEGGMAEERELCSLFAAGLGLYRNRDWQEAIAAFKQAIELRGKDGPSVFYINLCTFYTNNPPGKKWNGIVLLDKK